MRAIILVGFFLSIGIKSFTQNVQIENDRISSPKLGIGTINPEKAFHLIGSALMVQEGPLENIIIGTKNEIDAKFAVFSKGFGNGVIIDAPSTPGGYGLYINGSAHINGNLSKSGGTFKIDHPMDPFNKYLSHAFVESPEMLNVYSGNCTTDSEGLAKVHLPKYFESLNKDYRYQLTVLGAFSQAIIWKKIENNMFEIKTQAPNIEVSWQVTGVRKDAWALKNPIKVEEAKPMAETGRLLNP